MAIIFTIACFYVIDILAQSQLRHTEQYLITKHVTFNYTMVNKNDYNCCISWWIFIKFFVPVNTEMNEHSKELL